MSETRITPAQMSDYDWQSTIFCIAYASYSGQTPSVVAASYTTGNPIEVRVDTGLQNDELFYKCVLAAGTYSFFLLTDKDINRGVVQLRIDGTNVGSTFDCYASTRVSQAYGSLGTGINIAANGLHTISVKATSKNASSSGFIMSLNRIVIVRTA